MNTNKYESIAIVYRKSQLTVN